MDDVNIQPKPAVNLDPDKVYDTVFKPDHDDPAGTPPQYMFLRDLVHFQSGVILFLMFLVILTSVVFADKDFYHLVILNRKAQPERVHHLYPLDEPNLTRTAITNMVEGMTTKVLTFGFNNADERLLAAKRLFTKVAWDRFVKGYLGPQRLDRIKDSQQVLTAIATKGAVIVWEGRKLGKYRWVVQVPILITYQAGQRISPQRTTLQVTLEKASTLKYREGVAILAWEML